MTTRTCSGCATEVPADERFCPACGAALPQFHAGEAPVPAPVLPPPPLSTSTEPLPAESTVSGALRCEVCASQPAANVTFREGIGLVFSRRVSTMELVVCRDCGWSLGRTAMNATLWKGWWGLISFFTNLAYIAGNTAALWRVGQLAPPSDGRNPLPPGNSVFARGGFWIACALGVVLISIGAASGNESTSPTYTPPNRPSSNPTSNYTPPAPSYAATWRVGACVEVTGSYVEPVSCTGYTDGRIIDSAYSSAGCPYATDSYVDDSPQGWCIDEN